MTERDIARLTKLVNGLNVMERDADRYLREEIEGYLRAGNDPNVYSIRDLSRIALEDIAERFGIVFECEDGDTQEELVC
jgi:hypothetical protein